MTVDYKHYHLLITKLPVPYAYLQLAPGENPTGCIVFDANPAFEAMVGHGAADYQLPWRPNLGGKRSGQRRYLLLYPAMVE